MRNIWSRSYSGNQAYWLVAPTLLVSYLTVLWGLFMAAAIGLSYIRGSFEQMQFPQNTFLPHPVTRFGDYFGVISPWIVNGGLGGVDYGLSYLPATYIPIHAIALLEPDPWSSLPLMLAPYLILLPFLVFIMARSLGFLSSLGITVLIGLSYPSLLAVHTANLEMWVALLLLGSALAARKGQWIAFGLLIGIAASFKGLPIVFLAIPFVVAGFRIGLRSALSAGLTGLVTTIFALSFLPNGLTTSGVSGVLKAIVSIRESMAMYSDLMITGGSGIPFGHSLLNSVHALWGLETLPSASYGAPVLLAVTTIAILSLIWIRNRRVGFPQSLVATFTIVAAAACVGVPTSTDYKLLYLAPGLVLLLTLDPKVSLSSIKFQHLALGALMVFSMAPKPWLYVGGSVWAPATSYMTTLALLAIILVTPMLVTSRDPKFLADGSADIRNETSLEG